MARAFVLALAATAFVASSAQTVRDVLRSEVLSARSATEAAQIFINNERMETAMAPAPAKEPECGLSVDYDNAAMCMHCGEDFHNYHYLWFGEPAEQIDEDGSCAMFKYGCERKCRVTGEECKNVCRERELDDCEPECEPVTTTVCNEECDVTQERQCREECRLGEGVSERVCEFKCEQIPEEICDSFGRCYTVEREDCRRVCEPVQNECETKCEMVDVKSNCKPVCKEVEDEVCKMPANCKRAMTTSCQEECEDVTECDDEVTCAPVGDATYCYCPAEEDMADSEDDDTSSAAKTTMAQAG